MFLRRHFILYLIISVILFPTIIFAEEPAYPEKKKPYVNDYVSFLGEAESLDLEQKLKDFENRRGNQINVAIINSSGNTSISTYATKLYEKWKIGGKEDNGILILVLSSQKQIYIKVGLGVAQYLDSELCNFIIENEIAPAFGRGNYLEGIEAGLSAIEKALEGKYQAEAEKQEGGILVFIITLIAAAIFFILFSKFGQIRRRRRR